MDSPHSAGQADRTQGLLHREGGQAQTAARFSPPTGTQPGEHPSLSKQPLVSPESISGGSGHQWKHFERWSTKGNTDGTRCQEPQAALLLELQMSPGPPGGQGEAGRQRPPQARGKGARGARGF